MNRTLRRGLTIVVLGCSAGVLPLAANCEEAPRGSTHWRELPLPGQPRSGGVSQIAVDGQGVLWTLARGGVFYWTGAEFRPPLGDALESGSYFTRMFGGQDRELYVAQSGKEEQRGRLYRLRDGKTTFVADFEYEVSHEYPGLHVSRTGRVFNWGKSFVAEFVEGEWTQHPAALSQQATEVAEVGDTVYFCFEGKLYSLDATGAFERELSFGDSVTLHKTPRLAAWGEDRLLLLSKDLRSLFALNAQGEPLDLLPLRRELRDFYLVDMVSLPRGIVWLRLGKAFYRVEPGKPLALVAGTEGTPWRDDRYGSFRQTALAASDGAVWLALGDASLARCKDGRLERFDWRDGLSLGDVLWLAEGRKGEIYAASTRGVFAWNPDGPGAPPPRWTQVWEEFRAESYGPLRDSEGNIWMLFHDRPQEISCWDGASWRRQPVPFDPAKVYRSLADDQGHLLIESDQRWYDVSPARIEKHPDLQAALVAAVGRGVQRFDTGGRFQGCLVQPGGKIWFGFNNDNEVHYYDGEQWQSFPLRESIDYLYESPQYGVLALSQSGKFYTSEEGNLQFVTELENHTRWLWGEKRFQPFESALLEQRPRDFAIVERGADGSYLATRRAKWSPDRGIQVSYAPGDSLPQYPAELTRAWRFGHWTGCSGCEKHRILGNRAIPCTWEETPLEGRGYDAPTVLEDRGGNLWMRIVSAYGPPQVFRKRTDDFQLRLESSASEVGDATKIGVRTDDGWHGDYRPRIFWRIDGGDWLGGQPTDSITIQPARSGEYEVEVLGMDRQGGSCTSRVKIRVAAPKSEDKRD